MLRLLILLGLVAVAVLMVMKLKRGRGSAAAPTAKPEEPQQPAAMVACAHCGVHLPRPDALFDPGGRPYCGEPHRLAGPR